MSQPPAPVSRTIEFPIAPFKRRFGPHRRDPQPHRVHYSKPTLITTYTLTADRRIVIPGQAPLFRQFPPQGSNLFDGYPERYYPKFEVKGIDSIIAVLRHTFRIRPTEDHREKTLLPLPRKVDFVSFRNNFNKIMGTPYASFRDQWIIELHRVDGTVFMNVKRTRDELVHFEKEHIVHRSEMAKRESSDGAATEEQHSTESVCSVGQKRGREEDTVNEENEREAKRARRVTTVRMNTDDNRRSIDGSNSSGIDSDAMSPEEYDRHFRQKQRELVEGMESQSVTDEEVHRTKFMYQGYCFETMCSVDPKDIAQTRINPNEEFCGMFVCKLGQHGIILCAELDCLDEKRILPGNDRVPPSTDGKINQDLFVEVKTNRQISNDRNKASFEKYKLLKAYIQSFLVATPKIVFGFRDDSGRVKACQVFDTLKIPSMTSAHWDPWSCLNFTDALLSFIAENTEDDKTYVLQFTGSDAITMEESQDVLFMPQDFIDEWKLRPKTNA